MGKRLADKMWETMGVVDRDNIQFIGLGEYSVIGDAIGPMVGSMLEDLGYDVVGTISSRFNEKTFDYMNKLLKPNKIKIAIDAAVSIHGESNLYKFSFTKGGVKPGRALGKKLVPVGDFGILVPFNVIGKDNNETIELLKDVDYATVNNAAITMVEEIELYLSWCDDELYRLDDEVVSRDCSDVVFVYNNRELVDDIEFNQYAECEEDYDLLLRLGDVAHRGFNYPKGMDFEILELFNRNVKLYDVISRHRKTSNIIYRNDFIASDFEMGAKVYQMEYDKSHIPISYLKEYLCYMNIQPNFDTFVEGVVAAGLGYGDGDYAGIEYDLYEDYIKWW